MVLVAIAALTTPWLSVLACGVVLAGVGYLLEPDDV